MGPHRGRFRGFTAASRTGRLAGDRPSLCGSCGVSHGGSDFSCWTTHNRRTRMHMVYSDNSEQPQIFILGWGVGGEGEGRWLASCKCHMLFTAGEMEECVTAGTGWCWRDTERCKHVTGCSATSVCLSVCRQTNKKTYLVVIKKNYAVGVYDWLEASV